MYDLGSKPVDSVECWFFDQVTSTAPYISVFHRLKEKT